MKKFLALFFLLLYSNLFAQNPNLLPTPPMGWNSWNFFEGEVSEQIIKEIADAMVATGMQSAGYEYLIIDDYWVGGRDNRNRLYPDPARFPNGMKALADYVHAKGLKLGIYSNAAEYTCGGVSGSYGFEVLDAHTFAEWGIDYLKYDYCNAPEDLETAFLRYKKMGDALKNSGRDIVFAVCEWGQRRPWLWAKAAGGHLWRTTYDSRDTWNSDSVQNMGAVARGGIIELFDLQEGLAQYAGPNGWNDPDMLMVGLNGKGKSSSLNGKLKGCTLTEYQSNFALWCMLAAPLIVNSDLRNIDPVFIKLLTNKYLIAINQDSLGKQGVTIFNDGILQVLKKDLSDEAYSVCILNRSEHTTNYCFNLKEDFKIWYPATLLQVWNEKKSQTNFVEGKLAAHACEIFIIRKKNI